MAFQNYPVPSPRPSHAQTDRNSPSSQIDGVIFPSAARAAATYTSDPVYNPHAKGVRIFTYVENDGAAGTVTTTIQVKDPVTDTWVALAGAVTAGLTETSQPAILTVYPGIVATANIAVPQHLGSHWRLSTVVAANDVTFSIGADYLY
jgi:hypothetical protein